MGDRPLTVRQLAEAVGKSPQQIKRLERMGILPTPRRGQRRSDGAEGFRVYFPDDVRKIRDILYPPRDLAS